MSVVKSEENIRYAEVDGTELCLDLYRPDSAQDVPVVLYLHGGGWARGDRRDFAAERLEKMASNGIAVASASYRLAPRYTYPAQIHDVKAAVRWLRGNGRARGLSVEKIGIWGASAGGYLATMSGLTAGDEKLEGTLGSHRDQSSTVQAVVTWFSHHDFVTVTRRSPLETRLLRTHPAIDLFGVETITDEVVGDANPSRRVHRAAPPFLIAHGDSDHIVWASESAALHASLSREGVDATLCLLAGAGHEDPRFDSATHLAMTASWLKEKLR